MSAATECDPVAVVTLNKTGHLKKCQQNNTSKKKKTFAWPIVCWFKDTLPDAPIDRIAVLRLDGDLYESTIQALDALYPRLSPGGFCIIDDYHAIKACRQAVTDYRAKHGLSAEIVDIDQTGVLWRK